MEGESGGNRRGYFKSLSEQNVILFGFAMFLTFAAFNTSQNVCFCICFFKNYIIYIVFFCF